MIGTRVRWRWTQPDGVTPVTDLAGVVIACGVTSGHWSALVKLDSGGYKAVDPKDLIEVADPPNDAPTAESAALSFHTANVLALAAKIQDLGLATAEEMKHDPVKFAMGLLDEFMKELRETADKVTALEAEIAKLKKKKAKAEEGSAT